jgi:hypothetical protein
MCRGGVTQPIVFRRLRAGSVRVPAVLLTHRRGAGAAGSVAAAIGDDADWNTVAGMLGAFGRRLKSRYKLKTKPFERRYEHGVGKVYRMLKEIAQQVLQALKDD